MSRTIPLEHYRNLGIVASHDAGRTTTTERILAVAALGGEEEPVEAGHIQQDNVREITLTSAATSCFWRGCRITLVQLPAADRLPSGNTVAVLDGIVLMVDGTLGVLPEIGTALQRAEAQPVARLVFVNKLDQAGVSLDAIMAAVAAAGPATPILLNLPIGTGGAFSGLVDVVGERAVIWRSKFDARDEAAAVPAAMMPELAAARAALIAAVAPGAGELDAGSLRDAVRAAVHAGTVVPVLCGAAFQGRGIRDLLDAVVDYLPAPSDLDLALVAADGSAVARAASDDAPFSGLAFQTVEDPTAGTLTFVRIYSGVVAKGSVMLNSASATPERIGAMMRVHANHTEPVDEARTGDIVALTGLVHTATGDTLCDPAAPVILERAPARPRRVKH